MRLVHPENADAAIVVTLSGRVIYFILLRDDAVDTKRAALVIVVSVLVFLKITVSNVVRFDNTGLFDKQTRLLTSRYKVLREEHCCRKLVFKGVVTEGGIVMERKGIAVTPEKIPSALPEGIAVRVLLRDKSKSPDNEPQLLNAHAPIDRSARDGKVIIPFAGQLSNA